MGKRKTKEADQNDQDIVQRVVKLEVQLDVVNRSFEEFKEALVKGLEDMEKEFKARIEALEKQHQSKG